MASGPDQPDLFDLLPDPILLLILNHVSDIKTLLRCRSLSTRFNSLVPLADSLLLRVDRVISADDSYSSFTDGASFLSTLFQSLVSSLHHLIPYEPPTDPLPNSPSQILLGFHAINNLRIELPSGGLRLEKGTSIKWVARFGKTLQSCVILAFRNAGDSCCSGNATGALKMRVVWTISALIAASARHYMVADVVNEQSFLSHLVVNDRENEGTMIMDKDGLREFRESGGGGPPQPQINTGGGVWWRSYRTTVPAVGIRMRHEPKLELSDGITMEGATLVVVRPASGGGGGSSQERRNEAADDHGDDGLVAAAFGMQGVYAEAAARLLKSRSYILQMNSF